MAKNNKYEDNLNKSFSIKQGKKDLVRYFRSDFETEEFTPQTPSFWITSSYLGNVNGF